MATEVLSLKRSSGDRIFTLWKSAYKLRANLFTSLGFILVALFLCIAIFGAYFSPYPPLRQDIVRAREFPSSNHWFGTDELGRDLFSRVVAGTRITFRISFTTLIIACTIGLGIGLVSGYFGGKLDSILMRLIDVQIAIPGLVLALAIISIVGVGLNSLVFVMSIFSYPSFARLTRGLTLKAREEGYVEAAVAIGATDTRIVAKHILPNVLPHVLTLVTVGLGRVVLSISSLGFLGLGVKPGTPEWGIMIAQGRNLFRTHPHMVLFPGLAVFTLVIGFNLLGDGLRDFLDPRLRRIN